MNRYIRMLLILPFLIVPAACVASSSSGAGSTPQDRNMLSREQIIRYSNAYDAVQTMRRQWLRGRAPADLDTPGGIVDVYRDGHELGGVNELRSMSTDGIDYIRFYNGIQASGRWGLGHENGVIFVSSQSGVGPGY